MASSAWVTYAQCSARQRLELSILCLALHALCSLLGLLLLLRLLRLLRLITIAVLVVPPFAVAVAVAMLPLRLVPSIATLI